MAKTIMHCDKPVIDVEMDQRRFVVKVGKIYDKSLLPCVFSEKEEDLKIGLQRWMLSRQVGRTRADIAPIKAFYGAEIFESKNMVSLQDCYWIRNEKEETWEQLSPFRNWSYEDDCYFELLHDPENTYEVDNISPNLTIPGLDPRFWYIYNGELGLITEASQMDMKLYKVAKEMQLEKYVAPRSYIPLRGTIYSFHPSGTSEQVERIPFDVLYDSVAVEGVKKIDNLRNCCETYHLKNWKDFMSSVMRLDEALGNKERNLCELGVLRKTDTLEIMGFDRI